MSHWGYVNRDKPGPRGVLARWWYRRRSKGIAKRSAKQREQLRKPR